MKLTVLFLISILIWSCKKTDAVSSTHSSVKIIETATEPKQVNSIQLTNGNIVLWVCSGDELNGLAFPQEFFLITPNGELINTFTNSDTAFQYVHCLPCIDGGFICVSSTSHGNYILIQKMNDNGVQELKNIIPFTTNFLLNSPNICTDPIGNFVLEYQVYGDGYYISRVNRGAGVMVTTKIPSPAAIHHGTGLVVGEKVVDVFQPNDSVIFLQGVTYDQYNETVENCFVRELRNNVTQRWFSSNYDSTHFEHGNGFGITNNNQLVFFGTKSLHSVNEYYGFPFARIYNSSGALVNELQLSPTYNSLTLLKKTIATPDGGFLLIGSDNQYPVNDLVSDNHIALMKLNNSLQMEWSKEITNYYPSKAFDATYLNDGSMLVFGLIKDNLAINRIMILHLNSNGELIK